MAKIPDFIQQSLAEVAESLGFVEFDIETDTSANAAGFQATMLSVTLVGKLDKSTESQRLPLIIKLKPTSSARQEQFQSKLVFDREVFMYNTVLPAIEELQREKGIDAADALHAYPKCYLAKENCIILENLQSSGHVTWDLKRPVGFQNAKLIFEQLGLLHGVSVALRQKRPEFYKKLEQLPDIIREMVNSPFIQVLWNSTFDRALKYLDKPEHIKIIQAFKKNYKQINLEAMNLEKLGEFSVLGHGDSWNNNMMYILEDDVPNSITLLDWQLSRITSPAIDLSYFLFSSTEKSLRDQHFHELLEIYYENFSGIIRKCGFNPDKLYTFADLQAQLKEYGVYGALTAPMLSSIVVANKFYDLDKLCEDVNGGSTEGHFAVIDETNEQLYKQRVADVLDDAIKYGWISKYL